MWQILVSKKNPTWMLLGALLLLAVMNNGVKPKAALAEERSGKLILTKDCSSYTGAAGSFCTIESSNLNEIPVLSKIFYTQAFGDPTSPEGADISLDSNVVLYVGQPGTGHWAVGRCTLNTMGNGFGECIFSDGTGPLTGFHAHLNVSPQGDPTKAIYLLEGTYRIGAAD